jgi:putative SOS response-associated peptidase YedK
VHDAHGKEQHRFAIITTVANKLVAQIHNRMPVLLDARDEKAWLNPSLPLGEAQELLVPFPADLMTAYEVSTKVNTPAHNTPDVIERV